LGLDEYGPETFLTRKVLSLRISVHSTLDDRSFLSGKKGGTGRNGRAAAGENLNLIFLILVTVENGLCDALLV
jgi:hypothetical protein